MTDFIFSNDSGSVNVTFRTDQIGDNDNITIMSISGLDEQDKTNNNKEKMLTLYKKNPVTVGDLADFATHHKLTLTSIDADGVAAVLVDYGSQSS